MSKADTRPPAQILDSISRKAVNVKAAATALSERIARFEDYLAKLPGRVETDYYGPHPDAETREQIELMALVLRLHRQGKSWILSYGTSHELWNDDAEDPVEFKPLSEAPLKIKVAAVKLFPNLLGAIEKSQEELVEEIEKASLEFDQFAASLKLTSKEGK